MDLRELAVTTEESSRHPWEQARLLVVADLIKKYVPELLGAEKVIFDIGCGDTYFIEQLSKIFPNFRFIAVDTAFTPDMLEAFRKKFANTKIRVYASLDTVDASDISKVDAVLLLDVIEHIENDIEFLKWLSSYPKITRETNFIITVPAYQSLFCQHDVFLGHYRRYDNELLNTNIGKAGLNALRIGYFFTSLLLPRVVQVMVEKAKGSKNVDAKGLASWSGGGFKTSLVKSVLYTDYKFSRMLRSLGVKIPGLSNYVICRKK